VVFSQAKGQFDHALGSSVHFIMKSPVSR